MNFQPHEIKKKNARIKLKLKRIKELRIKLKRI